MNFIRFTTRHPSAQSVRLMTSPERELFRDDGYDENFNEAVSMSAFVQDIYDGEDDDVTVEDEFYANLQDLQGVFLTPTDQMIDPDFIPDPPRLQRSRNVQPVYVGMEPRQLVFDGPEPLEGWDSDSLSTISISMTTDEEDDLSVSDL